MRTVFRLFIVCFFGAAIALGLFYAWATQALNVSAPTEDESAEHAIEFRIPPGSSLRAAVQILNTAGVPLDADLFALLATGGCPVTASCSRQSVLPLNAEVA